MRPTIACTLGDCVHAEGALGRIGAQPWPTKTAYHIARLIRGVRAHTKSVEQARRALIKEIGTARAPTEMERAHGSDPEVFEVPPDRMAEYVKRHGELHDRAVSIEWSPLTVEMLGDARVSGNDLADLGPLLADAPEPERGGASS